MYEVLAIASRYVRLITGVIDRGHARTDEAANEPPSPGIARVGRRNAGVRIVRRRSLRVAHRQAVATV